MSIEATNESFFVPTLFPYASASSTKLSGHESAILNVREPSEGREVFMPDGNLYNPDEGAQPYNPWDIALLSQRDLGLQIPVNFVTGPGISLQAACFAHGVYDTAPAVKCLSNLLALGYRRFLLDVYWDTARLEWSFCPAQVPNITDANNGVTSIALATATSDVDISTVQASARRAIATDLFAISEEHEHAQRQVSSSSASVTQASSVASSISVSSGSASLTTPTNSSSLSMSPSATVTALQTEDGGSILLQLGPYQCSTEMDLLSLMEVLADFLHDTQDTVRALLVYLTLNLHAAAPLDDPASAAQQPADADLPSPNNLLSNVMNTNLSSYVYMPSSLRDEREDLNKTWYIIPYEAQPDSHYYNTAITSQNIFFTSDGWPSESYVEFQREERLFIEFGDIDPQMQNYDFDGDSGTIFPQNYFTSIHNVTFAPNETVSRGCFFDGTAINTTSSNNNSWATYNMLPAGLGASVTVAGVPIFDSVNNLTSCGISTFLNSTLSNKTADQDINAYRSFPLSSIWSWSPGEPRNVSSSEDNDKQIRCAVMDMDLQGHWRIDDCTNHHFSACRVNSLPYEWVISDQKGSYSSSAEAGCGGGQSFSVPRTGLENAYLFDAWKRAHRDEDGDHSLWVDFNSLDQQYCWVAGVNSTCPYTDQSDATQARTVIVPTVAAIIIFVLAALTLFVKCAANRQSSKRRRRRKGEDGWDYEGVPS